MYFCRRKWLVNFTSHQRNANYMEVSSHPSNHWEMMMPVIGKINNNSCWWKSVWRFLKTLKMNLLSTMWPIYSTPGYWANELQVNTPQRYLSINVNHSTVHHSWVTEPMSMSNNSPNRYVKCGLSTQWDVFCPGKEQSSVIYRKVATTGHSCIKLMKPASEIQILYISFIWSS